MDLPQPKGIVPGRMCGGDSSTSFKKDSKRQLIDQNAILDPLYHHNTAGAGLDIISSDSPYCSQSGSVSSGDHIPFGKADAAITHPSPRHMTAVSLPSAKAATSNTVTFEQDGKESPKSLLTHGLQDEGPVCRVRQSRCVVSGSVDFVEDCKAVSTDIMSPMAHMPFSDSAVSEFWDKNTTSITDSVSGQSSKPKDSSAIVASGLEKTTRESLERDKTSSYCQRLDVACYNGNSETLSKPPATFKKNSANGVEIDGGSKLPTMNVRRRSSEAEAPVSKKCRCDPKGGSSALENNTSEAIKNEAMEHSGICSSKKRTCRKSSSEQSDISLQQADSPHDSAADRASDINVCSDALTEKTSGCSKPDPVKHFNVTDSKCSLTTRHVSIIDSRDEEAITAIIAKCCSGATEAVTEHDDEMKEEPVEDDLDTVLSLHVSDRKKIKSSIQGDMSKEEESLMSTQTTGINNEPIDFRNSGSGVKWRLARGRLNDHFAKKQKPYDPWADRKTSGAAFIQDGPCFALLDVTSKKFPKCSACRVNDEVNECRFNDFRKLRFVGDHVQVDGFTDSDDAKDVDRRIWMPAEIAANSLGGSPSPADISSTESNTLGSVSLGPQQRQQVINRLDAKTATMVLTNVGDIMCDLVRDESQAIAEFKSWMPSESDGRPARIKWKRVYGVREMCDVCSTTIFNLHWTCGQCGFVACIDCFRTRAAAQQEQSDGSRRTDRVAAVCSSRQQATANSSAQQQLAYQQQQRERDISEQGSQRNNKLSVVSRVQQNGLGQPSSGWASKTSLTGSSLSSTCAPVGGGVSLGSGQSYSRSSASFMQETQQSRRLRGSTVPLAFSNKDELNWLYCGNPKSARRHDLRKLLMTQIIPGEILQEVNRRQHVVRLRRGIPARCVCSSRFSSNADGSMDRTIVAEKIEANQHALTGPLEPDSSASGSAGSSAIAAGALMPVSHSEKRNVEESFDHRQIGHQSRAWWIVIKSLDKKVRASLSYQERRILATRLSSSATIDNGRAGSSSSHLVDLQVLADLATQQERTSSAISEKHGRHSPHKDSDESNSKSSQLLGVFNDSTRCQPRAMTRVLEFSRSVLESQMRPGDNRCGGHSRLPQSLHRLEPLASRIAQKIEGQRMYAAPHEWLCNGRLLLLLEATRHNDNMELFQEQWNRGQPVIVSRVSDVLDPNLWRPDAFLRDFGDQKSTLVDCKTGSDLGRPIPMRRFWEGFECFARRMCDRNGEPMLLKLKDWPPDENFSEVLPDRYADLMRALPLPMYTLREGSLNLANRLPDCFVPPDLGPKMYNAYGSALFPSKGTTNLHLDVSDAANVMVYVGIPRDGNCQRHIEEALKAVEEAGCDAMQMKRVRERGAKVGAVWHIFHARDADKIRELLREVTIQRGQRLEANSDPIHDQLWYLDRELRHRLYVEKGVEGYAIAQCVGDAVFIPAGAPHQVRNLHSCIKVAEDFVSPENLAHCLRLTNEFRFLSDTHTNHEDKLQIKNVVYHAVKDAVSVLNEGCR